MKVKGYLLDTNILAYWFDSNRPEHKSIVQKTHDLPPETPLRISAITWGEIEYGLRCVSAADTADQMELKRFVETQCPHVLNIEKKTMTYYGDLRARLFDKYAPKEKRRKGLRPEQLVDPVTSLELGIQENDLWIAAQAVEFNLTLVTHERMTHLRAIAGDTLLIEDWAT